MAKEQLQRVCSLLLETPLESCLHSYSKSLTPKGVCWYLDNTVFINSRRHVALRSINLASFAAMPSRSAWSAWESAYMAFSGTRFGRRTSAVMRESCRENMRVCWRRSSRSWETTVLITDIRFNATRWRCRVLHGKDHHIMDIMEKMGYLWNGIWINYLTNTIHGLAFSIVREME